MSTFLEMVQEVRQGALLQGSAPTSVSSLVGPEASIPGYVNDVWNEIQTYEVPGDGSFWKWMRRQHTFSADPSEDAYDLDYIFNNENSEPPSANPPEDENWDERFKEWKKYPVYASESIDEGGGYYSIDSTGKFPLKYKEWDEYQWLLLNASEEKKPSIWTIRPQDDALLFGNLRTYTQIWIDYQIGPQVLVNDTDVPEFKSHWHRLIVDGAIVKTANQFGNSIKAQEAAQDYAKMFGELLRKENPKQKIRVRGIA